MGKNLHMRFEETGEVRPPRTGEYFRGTQGIDQARFDFSIQRFPILRMILEPVDEKGERDG